MRISCGIRLGISLTLFIHLADVHLGAEGAEVQAFYALVNQIAKRRNTYVTLQGRPDRQRHAQFSDGHIQGDNATEPAKAGDGKSARTDQGQGLCILPAIIAGGQVKTLMTIPMYDIAAKLILEDRYRADIAFVPHRARTQSHALGQRQAILVHHGLCAWGRRGRIAWFGHQPCR